MLAYLVRATHVLWRSSPFPRDEDSLLRSHAQGQHQDTGQGEGILVEGVMDVMEVGREREERMGESDTRVV